MNDPSVNSRVGFPYGRVLYEPRHERVMAGVWEYLWLKYFAPTDTLWKWYISKELGAEPYRIKRCWVSLPPPPSSLGLDTCDSPFPRWGARIWKGNDCYTGCYIPFLLFHSFPSEASTIVGEPKRLERMLSLEPQAPVITLIITQCACLPYISPIEPLWTKYGLEQLLRIFRALQTSRVHP